MANEMASENNTLKLVLAWLLVGIPLLWGVYNTLLSALPLFK